MKFEDTQDLFLALPQMYLYILFQFVHLGLTFWFFVYKTGGPTFIVHSPSLVVCKPSDAYCSKT